MSGPASNPGAPTPTAVVLLIDDQPMIGEGVRRMLASHPDISYHYCSDPRKAFATAQDVKPTVIFVDLAMPQLDGLALVEQFRGHSDTQEVPLVVLTAKEDARAKADAFGLGVDDYLLKLPDRTELVARIRYHSRGYTRFLERNAAFVALANSEAALTRELREAEAYVHSLLQPPLRGAITTNWTFVASSTLGGDSLGYQWLDDDHFAAYMLDVCGHGVGAALLSASALHALRSRALGAPIDFRDPGAVLDALNDAFPMELHNDMYIAVWYGVFKKTRRRLRYASGGHPPAVLLGPVGNRAQPSLLRTPGPSVGLVPETKFEAAEVEVPKGSLLYVFSDGALELNKGGGGPEPFAAFLDVLSRPLDDGEADLNRIKAFVVATAGASTFEDDFSILRVDFE